MITKSRRKFNIARDAHRKDITDMRSAIAAAHHAGKDYELGGSTEWNEVVLAYRDLGQAIDAWKVREGITG